MSTAFHQKLAAFNLDLALLPSAFVDTPPPTPSFDGTTLPKDWLQQLGAQHFNAPDFFKDKYPGYKAREALLKDLQLVYARLFGLLDHQLEKITVAEIQDTVAVLKYGLTQCAEGFHNRLNIILSNYAQPQNLSQLLYKVRMNLAEKAAALITTDIHGQNTVLGMGETLGLGIRMINPLDSYSGGVNEPDAERVLKDTFEKQFRALALPFLLCEQIEKIAASYGYLGRNESPGGYETAESSLIPLLGERINTLLDYEERKNFIAFFELEEATSAIREINWLKLVRYLFEKLKINCINGELAFRNPTTLVDCTSGYRLCEDKQKPYFLARGAEIILLRQSEWKNNVEWGGFFDEVIKLRSDSLPYYQDLESRGCFESLERDLVKSLSASLESLQKLCRMEDEESWMMRNQSKLQLLSVLTHLDPKIIQQLFIQKSQRNSNILMLAIRLSPQAAEPLLTFLQNSREVLDKDLWRELCKTMLSQTDSKGWNVLMLAVYKPQALASLLTFFENSRVFLGNDLWRELCKTMLCQTDSKGWNVLVLAVNKPQALASFLTFFENSREFLDDEAWCELCKTMLSQIIGGNNALMLAVNKPQALASFLTFFENSREFLGDEAWCELCKTMLSQTDIEGWNALMWAVVHSQPKAAVSLLTFLNNSCEFLGDDLWRKLCKAMLSQTDSAGWNALILAARNQPQLIDPILDFLLQHPEVFSQTLSHRIVFAKLSYLSSSQSNQLRKNLTEKLSHYFALTISKIESDPQKYTWVNCLPILFEIEAKNILDIFRREKRSVKMKLFLFNSFVEENAEFILQKIGRDEFCELFITCLTESVDANDKDILGALRETLNLTTSLAQFFAKHRWVPIGETISRMMILDEIPKYEKRLAVEHRDTVSISEAFESTPSSAELIVKPLAGAPALESKPPVTSSSQGASLSLSLFEPANELPNSKFYDPSKFSLAEVIAIQSSVITAHAVSAPEKNPILEAADSLVLANNKQ
jgi:hypothetical protein